MSELFKTESRVNSNQAGVNESTLLTRRKFAAIGAGVLAVGIIGKLSAGRLSAEEEPTLSDNPNVETNGDQDVNPDDLVFVENDENENLDTDAEQDIIRVQDLPRDMSLYANLVSPEETMDVLKNGTEEDLRSLFEVSSTDVLTSSGELNPEKVKEVFEKIALGLRVGFDGATIEPFLNIPNGRQLFIEAATAHDELIAQIIGGYSHQDLISGKVEKKFLTRYLSGGHEKAAARFYDSATAADEQRRSLNETIRIDAMNVRPRSNSGAEYSVLTALNFSNVMDGENPPISPLRASGDMILWADGVGSTNVEYNLSPASASQEITPFDEI